MRVGALILFGVLAAVLPARAGGGPGDEDRPLRISTALQYYPVHNRAQRVGPMDRPVGGAITLRGVAYAARKDDRGRLQLDVRGDGRFRTISKRQLVTFTLKGEGKSVKTTALRLEVRQAERRTPHVVVGLRRTGRGCTAT